MKKLLMILVLVSSFMLAQAQETRTAPGTAKQSATVKQDNVPKKVLETFKQNFSTARNVTWNKYQNYYEASFTQNNKNYQVAITPSGQWIQTSISGSMAELPEEVKKQFQAGEYASYEVKNVRELSSTGNEKIYLVEVVSTAPDQTDPVYLYYEPTGDLYRVGSNQFITGSPVVRVTEAKEVSRDDLPPLVENAFVETHPDVKSVRWRMENNRYVAEYSDHGKRMYFVTSPEGNPVESVAQYNFNQLPQPVQDAYNKAQYKDWQIQDIEYVSPAFAGDDTNVKYRIYMYKTGPENNFTFKTLTYDARGNLLKVDQ